MFVNQKRFVWSLAAISLITAFGWAERIQPHIGCLYPAGGQRGRDVLMTAGGQFLQRPEAVYISGQGVHATIIKYYRPVRNIQKEQRELLSSRLKEVRDKRIAELPASVRAAMSPLPQDRPRPKNTPKTSPENPTTQTQDQTKQNDVKMPEHPLLYDLENKSLRQLIHITRMLFMPRSKLQPNRQIAETVLLKVTIDPDAKPGPRELRIKTATGLTNPMVLHVGTLPEYAEMEPNDQEAYPTKVPQMSELPKEKALGLPVVLNGQIMPGDIDRFRFRAQANQQLVIETHARSLIPYLADAVPGWFQATVTLYDADGNELAYADDYRFNPDPVLYYKIPKTGDYELAIRDSIYRGREDFVYRISVGELPFITQMFPLGAKEGEETVATIEGWNLPITQLSLDTKPGGGAVRQAIYESNRTVSNFISYAVDTLPQCQESDTNDTVKEAQLLRLPTIVNGQINASGDVDMFKFQGRAGDEITAEVYARRLNSPLDSLVCLTDASGKVLEWNDDYVIKDTAFLFKDTEGLLTHPADSYLTAKLPADGTYYIHITDAQQHGGPAYGYRLHLIAKTPDFALRITPSSLSPLPGEAVPVTVYVLRKDGFNGEIEVALKDAPAGFKIEGSRIPEGCEHIRMTLRAPGTTPDKPIALHLEGRAKIGDKTITRQVVPAEDMMQAFLFRHLVPSQELLVAVRNVRRPIPSVEISGDTPITIPPGGSAQVRLKIKAPQFVKQLRLELQNPPEGISLHNVTVIPGGLTLTLKADSTVKKDWADNLIIEVFRELTPEGKDGKTPNNRQQQPIGLIPAIPVKLLSS
ncbi:MAG: hypothetical protein ISS71_08745 [Phycisphaerae bacterium]|nr:hypothetical protein [Phycisphaerae bacterium]